MLGVLHQPCGTQFDLALGSDDDLLTLSHAGRMLDMLSRFAHPRAPAPAGELVVPWPADAVEPAGCRLDPAALARLAELDPKGVNHLIERVLRAFKASVARLRPQAEAARGSGDRAAIRLVAHTLKSSAASIGAMHLSQLCAEIETVIRLETGEDLGARLDALNVALDGALLAIDRLLAKGTA